MLQLRKWEWPGDEEFFDDLPTKFAYDLLFHHTLPERLLLDFNSGESEIKMGQEGSSPTLSGERNSGHFPGLFQIHNLVSSYLRQHTRHNLVSSYLRQRTRHNLVSSYLRQRTRHNLVSSYLRQSTRFNSQSTMMEMDADCSV